MLAGPSATGRQPAPRRRFRKVHAVLLAVALTGLAVTIPLADPSVYRFATNRGELVVETTDPDIEVTVKKDGETVQVLDKKSGRTVVLKAGLYQLELTGGSDGLTLSTDQFTLERGGKEVVRVYLGSPTITEVRQFKGAPEASYVGAFCLGDRCVLTGGGHKPDLKLSLGSDFDLRLWDRATGKELARLPSHRARSSPWPSRRTASTPSRGVPGWTSPITMSACGIWRTARSCVD